jgi:hypothetical protein
MGGLVCQKVVQGDTICVRTYHLVRVNGGKPSHISWNEAPREA